MGIGFGLAGYIYFLIGPVTYYNAVCLKKM